MTLSASADDRLPSAEFKPGTPKVARLLTLLLPTALALYANFQGVGQILLPLQVEAIDPKAKIANVAFLTMICAATGVLGLMTGGAASDVTRGRWGRRTPWLLAMALASAFISIQLGMQRGMLGISVLYGALWFTLNCFQGAMLAITPDRVPDNRRGIASSIIGMASPLGSLIGVNVAAVVAIEWGYASLGAALIASTVIFVVFAREGPWRAPAPRAPANAAGRGLRLASFLESFRSRDFSLAYAFRVLMFIAQYSINNYILYILQDFVGVQNLPTGNAQIAAGLLNSLRMAATIAAIAVGFWLANRTARRKIFAQGYAIVMAVAMLVPVFSPTWSGVLIFSVLGGVAVGGYSAIDLSLMSHVLPNKHSAGRDLAFLVMAGASSQFVAPLLGSVVIRTMGYQQLFVVCALLTLVCGAVSHFIRSVR